MADAGGLADQLADMHRRSERALRSIDDLPFKARTVPVFTDTERLLNYWNGYRAALDEIQRFITTQAPPR
jgi:hypothetical protein